MTVQDSSTDMQTAADPRALTTVTANNPCLDLAGEEDLKKTPCWVFYLEFSADPDAAQASGHNNINEKCNNNNNLKKKL